MEYKDIDSIEFFKVNGGPQGYFFEVYVQYSQVPGKGYQKEKVEGEPRVPDLKGAAELAAVRKRIAERFKVPSSRVTFNSDK